MGLHGQLLDYSGNALLLSQITAISIQIRYLYRIQGHQMFKSSWHHQMETFSAFLALCEGNSQVTGEFPSQRPVTQSFEVLFDLRLNKRLSKQSRRRWFETPSPPLWRHCNIIRQKLKGMTAHHSPDVINTNTLRPRPNERHFPYDVFICIFLIENLCISLNFSLFLRFDSLIFQHWFR